VRIGLLAISGWLVAAALTVGISWSAISVVRQSVVGGTQVVSSLPAPEETGSPTAAPTTARPSPSPTAATGALRTVAGQGGTVRARCVDSRLRVISSVPNQGFQLQRDDSGVELKFRSSTHETEIKLSCGGLAVQSSVEEKSVGGNGGGGDDGGGDDHGGGGGSGRGGGGGGGDD
jgi:hypothetical protein